MSYLVPRTAFEKKVKAATDKCMIKNYDKHKHEYDVDSALEHKEVSDRIFKRESERIAAILMVMNKA